MESLMAVFEAGLLKETQPSLSLFVFSFQTGIPERAFLLLIFENNTRSAPKVPGPVLAALLVLPHSILTLALKGGYCYYPPFYR